MCKHLSTFNLFYFCLFSEMQCARNKSTAIIKEMSEIKKEDLITRMKHGPYTISTDGSNDTQSKQYPIVVRSFNQKSGQVNSELLSVPICDGAATGENIFNLVDKELNNNKIPWSNCLALGCDNANVMVGENKGVYGFVMRKNPECYLAGCTLHLVHIGSKRGAAAAMPPVDDVLNDIYYYFDKSDKRKCRFKGKQNMFDVEQKSNLKHVCTRWLSIGKCMTRLLHNWDALKFFFKEEMDELLKSSAKSKNKGSTSAKSKSKPKASKSYAETKVENIYTFLRSPTNKLYVLFLNYAVKVFDEVLLGLQSEEPRIHVLRRNLHKLIRQILVKFVKPSAMVSKSVDEVNYKLSYNVKSKSELVIGEDASGFIAQKKQNYLKDDRIDEFYENVKLYFSTVCDYLIQKLPLNCPLLTAAEVVDVTLQKCAKVSDLVFFLNKYPCLMPDGVSKDKIVDEFCMYTCYDISGCIGTRIDDTWRSIAGCVDEDNNLMFENVAKVMFGILAIPHSSAHCERIFSCVRKNRTDQRASLGDSTLEALLVLKSSSHASCDASVNSQSINTEYTDQQLDRIGKAYYKSLNG